MSREGIVESCASRGERFLIGVKTKPSRVEYYLHDGTFRIGETVEIKPLPTGNYELGKKEREDTT